MPGSMRSGIMTFALSCACAGSALAQAGSDGVQAPETSPVMTIADAMQLASPWTFGVGESLEFIVASGETRAGEARMGVEARETVAGVPTFRVGMHVEARFLIFKVSDHWTSWITPEPMRALRVEQDVEEGSVLRHERFGLDYEAGRVQGEFWDEQEGRFVQHAADAFPPLTGSALDEIGYLFLLRMLPLEPGQTYRFESHFLPRGNPVTFEVLGREEVRVPAGRFNTIVVAPVLPGMGILQPGRNARAYLSDDSRRLLVMLTTSTPVGDVTLYLRRYEPGTPAEADSSASPR